MLDIVHAIVEWFLPIFVPGDQLEHKTSAVAQGSAESLSAQIPTGHDPHSPDPAATGLTGAHFMMVAFAVVTVWLVISNLTTRVVEQKRTSFRENRTPRPFDLPLHGIIDDNSDRHIWQENFVPSDLKLKWVLERHESDLHHLQKHQLEQDIKFTYLQRKLSRRDRHDPHRRSSIRQRPDIFLRESNRVLGKMDLHVTSEDEIDTLGKFPINDERCRCVQTRTVESDKRETERRGNGDEIVGEKSFNENLSPLPSNAVGQGDVNQKNSFNLEQRTNETLSELRQGLEQVQVQGQTTRLLLQRPRGPGTATATATADLLTSTKPKFFQTILGGGTGGGEKLVPTPTPPPTAPPRPELPRRVKLTSDNGVLDPKLVDRFKTRHPETCQSTESMASLSSGVSGDTASANPDAPRRETALVPESPSPVDEPSPDCAT